MQAVGTAEMARAMNASEAKVRELARSGQIPHIPVGRKLSFIPEHVFAALERTASAEKSIGQPPRSRRARRKVF